MYKYDSYYILKCKLETLYICTVQSTRLTQMIDFVILWS